MTMMTSEQVASYLECEPETVQRAALDGKLPGVKFGKCWLFPKSALDEALHLTAMSHMRMVKRAPAPAPAPASPGWRAVPIEPAPRRRRSGPPPILPPV